jgi:hypothetical protein
VLHPRKNTSCDNNITTQQDNKTVILNQNIFLGIRKKCGPRIDMKEEEKNKQTPRQQTAYS